MEYFSEDQIQPETVDPRVRMRQIRDAVSAYLQTGEGSRVFRNLGEMPSNMDDARRVIVALQDLLEDRTQRHNKASNHIAQLLEDQDFLGNAIMTRDNEILSLSVDGEELYFEFFEAHEENKSLKEQLDTKDRQLQAALTTLQTVMGG